MRPRPNRLVSSRIPSPWFAPSPTREWSSHARLQAHSARLRPLCGGTSLRTCQPQAPPPAQVLNCPPQFLFLAGSLFSNPRLVHQPAVTGPSLDDQSPSYPTPAIVPRLSFTGLRLPTALLPCDRPALVTRAPTPARLSATTVPRLSRQASPPPSPASSLKPFSKQKSGPSYQGPRPLVRQAPPFLRPPLCCWTRRAGLTVNPT